MPNPPHPQAGTPDRPGGFRFLAALPLGRLFGRTWLLNLGFLLLEYRLKRNRGPDDQLLYVDIAGWYTL
jgi:hypothetical protein